MAVMLLTYLWAMLVLEMFLTFLLLLLSANSSCDLEPHIMKFHVFIIESEMTK